MPKINYDSKYKEFANQTLNWLPADTQERFYNNFTERRSELQYWIDNPFTYKFNSHGFRTDEFTSDPTIMFLGCSYTCGIGVPIEHCWTTLLSDSLKLRSANLGNGGGSCDTAFRLCHGWIDKIKPTVVMLLTPPDIRFEVVTDYAIRFASANTELPFYKDWISDDTNYCMNKIKNMLAIEHMLNSRNIKFIALDSAKFTNFNCDLGRDLAHPGIETHKKFADYVLSKI